MLNKDEILKADDLKTETVPVPEWGGDVSIRMLTGSERDSFEASIIGNGKDKNFRDIRAKLCARCLVGEDGTRLFSDAEILALGGKSAKPLDRIFDAAQKLNGFTDADVEELEKNS